MGGEGVGRKGVVSTVKGMPGSGVKETAKIKERIEVLEGGEKGGCRP